MKNASPYLNFAGNTEEAFNHYRSIFGVEFAQVLRYRDMGDNDMNVPDAELDRIAHIALPLGDTLLMGTDVTGSQRLTIGNNFYVTLEADSGDEAERVFGGLSADGQVEMPMLQTSWAEKYGVCTDRFGVQWMVMYTGDVQDGGGAQA